jgi:predicted RNase H-like HicB family nuclease
VQISILIEPIADNGYRASSGEPLAVVVEAATREDALAKLKERVEARLSNGAEIVQFETAPPPHPLAEFVGIFKDDPYFADVIKIMAANRRKMDRTPKRSRA